MYTYIHSILAYIHTGVYVCMLVYVCMYMYVCMYVYVCMCVYAYMYMYVCIIYGELIVRVEMSYPKREGELFGGIVLHPQTSRRLVLPIIVGLLK